MRPSHKINQLIFQLLCNQSKRNQIFLIKYVSHMYFLPQLFLRAEKHIVSNQFQMPIKEVVSNFFVYFCWKNLKEKKYLHLAMIFGFV